MSNLNEVMYFIVRHRGMALVVVGWNGTEVVIEGGPSGRPPHRFFFQENAIRACVAANDARHGFPQAPFPEAPYEVFGVTRGGLVPA